jgi:glycosyltransferase involved in cell wall biosynthesis
MKIYSYLHSGRVLVATDLPTHRQVLDSEIAVLAEPKPKPFAAALESVLADSALRMAIGTKARERAETLYTVPAFEAQLTVLYDRVEQSVSRGKVAGPGIAVGDEA